MAMETPIVFAIDWEQCKRMWINYLWPDRPNVKSMSSMTDISNVDMTIYDKYEPMFFGLHVEGLLVGVNSGHKTSETHYRSRGLYVMKGYRGKFYGQNLLEATLMQAEKEGCSVCWSLPRRTALRTYEAVGFEKHSDWFDSKGRLVSDSEQHRVITVDADEEDAHCYVTASVQELK